MLGFPLAKKLVVLATVTTSCLEEFVLFLLVKLGPVNTDGFHDVAYAGIGLLTPEDVSCLLSEEQVSG